MEIIIGKQGNQKTPITEPTVSRRHCKVTINEDGTFTIENLSDTTYTKVDGIEIVRTSASLESMIELGPIFKAPLKDLIGEQVAPKQHPTTPKSSITAPESTVKTYNIAHLQRVWDDFNQTNLNIAEQQRKINLKRTGFGIFTMCAMPTIFFLGPIGYILTGIGILGNIYSFVGMKNSETPTERQQRQDAFDAAWVCPNPDCGRTLPAKNYRLLARNYPSCPHCKCKYVER